MMVQSGIQIRGRSILLAIWLFFFFLNGSIIVFLYMKGWIGRENLLAGMQAWNAVYAPYIGAITLFCWSRTKQQQTEQTNGANIAFALALICSLLWNGLILAFLLPPLRGTGAIETSLQNIREIVSLLSWLAAGAIGYYFAQPSEGTI